jgi:hypothetical protein
MNRKDLPQHFDAREEGKGFVAAGPTPTAGAVSGPLAPEPLPGGIEGEPPSEMRPRESDSRKSDGVAAFKEMEENAEDGRE